MHFTQPYSGLMHHSFGIMKIQYYMTKSSKISILVLLLAVGFVSCEKKGRLSFYDLGQKSCYQSEIFDSSYLNIYGIWERKSGSRQHFSTLIIKQFGIYGIESDSIIVEFGCLQIIDQSNKSLLIRFLPDGSSQYIFAGIDWYFRLIGTDTLSLGSFGYDGPYYYLERVK